MRDCFTYLLLDPSPFVFGGICVILLVLEFECLLCGIDILDSLPKLAFKEDDFEVSV